MTQSRLCRAILVFTGFIALTVLSSHALARDYTAGEGGAAEIDACAKDAAKYCNDDIMWQHEMEDCLREHIGQISKACRAQIKPFDFKQYYNSEPHLF
jgi:hypothetical protein